MVSLHVLFSKFAPEASTVLLYLRFKGGMNDGIWFLTCGSDTYVLKLVKVQELFLIARGYRLWTMGYSNQQPRAMYSHPTTSILHRTDPTGPDPTPPHWWPKALT